MFRKLLFIINCVVAAVIGSVVLITLSLLWLHPSSIPVSEQEPKLRPLPKSPFARESADYEAISHSFNLKFGTPPMEIPNLRPLLVFYGPSDRPDIPKDSTLLYFSLAGGKSIGSVAPGEKLYLMYNRNETPPQYVFSPGNKETPLWLEADLKGKEAQVKVGLVNEMGKQIRDPIRNAEFSLQEREFTRTAGGPPWELGKWRVDGTLLARQKTRWFGKDVFLEKHGGEEYENFVNKERIDFGEGEDAYSTYLGVGNTLIWKENQWQEVEPGKETHGYPLMQVKKIDERLMTFELWDHEGKHKITLNLLKSKEPWIPQQIEQDFKFVATRTRSQYVFEIQNQRVILRPQDWLILTDKGWEMIDTEQEIDDYVDRKLVGPMFVFDGMVKVDDKQVLVGTLFNATRTESQTVELAAPQSNVTVIKMPKEKEAEENNDVFGSDFFNHFRENIEE